MTLLILDLLHAFKNRILATDFTARLKCFSVVFLLCFIACIILRLLCVFNLILHVSLIVFILFYFQNLGCNHTTAKAENTIQYMNTWILKDECVAAKYSTNTHSTCTVHLSQLKVDLSVTLTKVFFQTHHHLRWTLQSLLPDRPLISYSLRERTHSKTLISKTSHPNDDDFLMGMLYKDLY